MPQLVPLLGCVALIALSLWIVGKARGDDPFIAHVLHPRRRDASAAPEDDDVRWRWGGR